MGILELFRRSRHDRPARAIYRRLVAQAREPTFYLACGVPDTPDGRFDLIALHAFLVLRRLKRDHHRTARLAQGVFDEMFHDMDHNLREMGVGDLVVGKRVKALVAMLYGRVAAYEAGLAAGDAELAAALRRNLYRHKPARPEQVAAVVGYVREQAACFDRQATERLLAGDADFGPPPDVAAGKGT